MKIEKIALPKNMTVAQQLEVLEQLDEEIIFMDLMRRSKEKDTQIKNMQKVGECSDAL